MTAKYAVEYLDEKNEVAISFFDNNGKYVYTDWLTTHNNLDKSEVVIHDVLNFEENDIITKPQYWVTATEEQLKYLLNSPEFLINSIKSYELENNKE